MNQTSYYQDYARLAIEEYSNRNEQKKYLLADSVKEFSIARVLDLGCGPGQEMLQFADRENSFCVGIDRAEELGRTGPPLIKGLKYENKISFVRSFGEELPFADSSFDVVLCRVALPYMDNKKTIAEISRVLRTGGVFLLKSHAPAFYFEMLKNGIRALSLRKTAYPLICLFAGSWLIVTGRQLRGGFWEGKEVFQTRSSLHKQLEKNAMKIELSLSDSSKQAPSYLIVKI